MNGARSYMQRGTRFCIGSKELWIEYAKLEMIYLAKISARRRILGLDRSQEIGASTEATEDTEGDTGFATSDDVIHIPNFKAHTLQSTLMEVVKVDTEAVNDPMTTPALNGAIPLAIFDHAKKQPFFSAAVAEDFFAMFASFTQIHCLAKVLQHVVSSMMDAYPTDPASCNCYVRQPIIGIGPLNVDFPMALASSLERLKESRDKTSDSNQLSRKVRAWIEPIMAVEGLDIGVETVLRHTLRKLEQ